MSVTSFRAANPAARRRWLGLGELSRPEVIVDGVLAGFVISMLVLMELQHGEETIPFHLLYLAVTVVYGFRVWPILPTLAVVFAVTASTGIVMWRHYDRGYFEAGELTEIPLMPALLLAMIWHARRRVQAQQEVERMAELRRASIDREREFFRDASHAIRTPVTIARGHLELAEPTLDEEAREDVRVALRQLSRMSVLSDRLLALAQLDAGVELRCGPVDLRTWLDEVGRNWSSSAERRWTIQCESDGLMSADTDWLDLAIDAVIENAVRHTTSGDEIVLRARIQSGSCVVSVHDCGPGIAPQDLGHVFERFFHRPSPDARMGSGLGLPMADAAVRAHGGTMRAINGANGGAVFEIWMPCLTVP